jgi:hypothetical protein
MFHGIVITDTYGYFLVSLSQWYFQNRELKRKSSVIAQKWSKEATEIVDEPDVGTSTDGDLDNLMQTIKGIFHFVYYFP